MRGSVTSVGAGGERPGGLVGLLGVARVRQDGVGLSPVGAGGSGWLGSSFFLS